MTLSLVAKVLHVMSAGAALVYLYFFLRWALATWTARREMSRVPGQGRLPFPFMANPDLFSGRARDYALQAQRSQNAWLIAAFVCGLCKAVADFLAGGAVASLTLSPQARTMLGIMFLAVAIGGAVLFVYSTARALSDLLGQRLRGTPVRGLSPANRLYLAAGALIASALAAILFAVHTGKLS